MGLLVERKVLNAEKNYMKEKKGNEFKKLLTLNRRGYYQWDNFPSLIAKVWLECRETTVES